jgi:hypothetical protein
MLKFDSALQSSLASAISKLDWCITLVNALGSDLKIRCKRSADSASTTVFDTGTEFFSASVPEAPARSGSSIVKFGTIVNATIHLAADLSTGASVLRIEGNGHWIEGTLGLTNSSCDFKVPQNPTASTGMAFVPLTISPPRSLPSGTGPVAPSLDDNAPAFIELEDWNDPNNVVLVGRIPLDTRAEDFVYQDDELAAEIGDVRITQSSKTIVYGQFEFGVTMFTIHGGLNLDKPGTPVHQVVVAHKPYGTWPSYPFADTFRRDRDTTFPKPYKIKIRKADNTILKTIEMRDGLPVNDPSLDQLFGPGYTKGLRPHMNCGQWHFWQSDRLKYNSNALKYFPGTTLQSQRETMAKNGISSNARIPLEVNSDQWNSTLHWYAAPEWPIAYFTSQARQPGYTYDDDPYLFVPDYHGDEGHLSLLAGWNVEPGSISMHDWFIGPGGPRHDRSALGTPLVRYFNNPNGVRLKGNVPHRQLLDCYNHGYFHHAHHMLMPDVKTFAMLPREYMRYGQIAWANAYYGNYNAYVPGGFTRHIDLQGIPNQGNWPKPVRDGHKGFWNGWEVDDNHSYIAPGLATIFCNSPAHTVSGTLRLYAHVCAQLASAPPRSGARSVFMTRVQAWRWHQLSVAWKIATTHSMGMDRENVEARFQDELEALYDYVYKPAMIDLSNDFDMVTVRRFGQISSIEYGTSGNGYAGYKWIRAVTDSKAGYFAGVLSLMRQTGCWAAMRRRSAKCDTALRFLVECMDKDTLMSLYYSKGRYERFFEYSGKAQTTGDPNRDIASNMPDPPIYQDWNEWVQNHPPTAQETLMTDSAGNATAANMAATTALRLQWAFVRRDFFPEIPSPMDGNTNIVNATCTMIQGWLDALEVKINGISSNFTKMGNDMTFCWPPHGIYKAPATLGPF